LLKADFEIRTNNWLKAKATLLYIVNNFKVTYVVWEQLLFAINSLNLNNELITQSDQVIKLFPEKPVPYLLKGTAYYNLKDYDKGITTLSKGLELINQSRDLNIQFHTYLGECFQAKGEYSKSEYHFEKVLQYDPLNIYVLNNYSYYLAVRGAMLDKALDYIKVCIKKFPNTANYFDTYAWVLFKRGDYLAARDAIEKAISLNGKTNFVYIEHYCEILFYCNDKQQSVQQYKILENNGKANQKLKDLLQIE
jgi:tetratricopeptide (TPR) repeat protein